MSEETHPVIAPNDDGSYKVVWEKGPVNASPKLVRLNVTLNAQEIMKTIDKKRRAEAMTEKRPLLGTQIGCQTCGAAQHHACAEDCLLPVTHTTRRRMFVLITLFEAAAAAVSAMILLPWGVMLVQMDSGIFPDFDSLFLAVAALTYGAPLFIVLFLATGLLWDWNDSRAAKVRRGQGAEIKCPFCKRWQLVVGQYPTVIDPSFPRLVKHRGWPRLAFYLWPGGGGGSVPEWPWCKGSGQCALCFGTKRVEWPVPTRPSGFLEEVCRACAPPQAPLFDSLFVCLNDLHATFQNLPKKEANTPEFALNLMDQQIADAREHLKKGRLDKVADELADMLGIAWQAIAWQGQDPEQTFIRRTRTRVIPHALELAERDRAGNGYKPPKTP